MASITGLKAGLVPQAIHIEPEPELDPRPKRKRRSFDSYECAYCTGIVTKKTVATYLDPDDVEEEFGGLICRHCADHFQLHVDMMPPAPFDVTLTKDRVGRAKVEGWAIILRTQKFGTDAGIGVQIEMGDVLKVTRAGIEGWPNKECSIDRSRKMGSVEVLVGPIPVTLFPHEFAPIKFLDVLALCKEGEMENKFVSKDDEVGFFSPTDDVRAQLQHAFGG